VAQGLSGAGAENHRPVAAGPVVIIGVGNRHRGDDGVGPALLDALAGLDRVHRLDAGSTPENFIMPVVRLEPGRILVVDACDFGGRPGEFRLFDRAQVEQLSYGLLSTHTLPLSLVVEMLARETGAAVCLLGVQPAAIEFNTGLSEQVRAALPALVGFVRRWAAD